MFPITQHSDMMQECAVICIGTDVRQQMVYVAFVILHFTTLAVGEGNVGVLGQPLRQWVAVISDVLSLCLTTALGLR